jgi:hypothetical protein
VVEVVEEAHRRPAGDRVEQQAGQRRHAGGEVVRAEPVHGGHGSTTTTA